MPTICLNMIVKNEAPIIERCLASVLPFVDHWVIVDTGSCDGTQDRIRACMRSKPGALHERPWRSFAHNRNEALDLAGDTADYVLFLDADERLDAPSGLDRSRLSADGYYLSCAYAGTTYARCALVATRLPWRWQGVVHEFLSCAQPHRLETLERPRIVVAHDGARSRDSDTYANDAALLEEALKADPDNARDVFYLAQSYRDAGQLARSRDVYRRRVAMGGWDEEVWFSLYQIGVLAERLGLEPMEISFAHTSAYQFRPTRAEPLVWLARYHRSRGELALALLYARRAAAIPRPADLLFVEDAAYTWQALDEVAVAAYYVGARDEGRAALQRLLTENRFPDAERARMFENARFYGIAQGASAAPHA